ncbi:MAG TPA: EAL domain-containing protein [Marinobacterium sp.]|nr:EAL domain-containing protein [Marinobacterium sp.]
MAETHSTFSLLDRLSQNQVEKRNYIDLLFSGFASNVSDGLLSLIRSSGMSPRGRVVRNRVELLEALADRSWDLVLCQDSAQTELHPLDVTRLLRSESRDLPVIQLAEAPSFEAQQEAINQGIVFLLPLSAQQMIVARVTQVFEQQKQKRRLHQLEMGLEQLAKMNRRYADESNLAIASVSGSHLTEPNNSFLELFQLTQERANHLELQQIFAVESLRLLNEPLKLGSSSFDDTLRLHDASGAEFSARVQLFPAMPDRPKIRPLVIDPLALTSKPTPAEVEAHRLLGQAEFVDLLQQQLQQAMSGGHDAYLLYFKVRPIPTTTDPSLLEQLRNSLAKCLRSVITEYPLGRLEPLDVAALIEGLDRSRAKSVAQQIQNCLSDKRLALPAGVSTLALGVGITAINDSSPGASELLIRAARSVRPLNEQFNQQAVFANPVQHQIELDSATKELEEAIAEHKLKLLYQPLVSLDEGSREQNYEILVRMSSGDSKDLLPAQFLASLEHARVMVKLDRWVLERTLQELNHRSSSTDDIRVYVNLARRTLKSTSFTSWLSTLLNELSLDGRRITLELSESDVAADLDDAERLCQEVRKEGISICLKHFGCSTSSGKVYARLKPEFVKLDGAFIEDLEYPDRGPRAMKRLVESIDKASTRVIAPLIEDASTLPDLYRMGIDMVQGYYLQPPQEEMRYEYFDERDES